MVTARVRFAILTSYMHTIFFMRDKDHPNVVYISRVFKKVHPVLLYITTFFVMATQPELLSRHYPKMDVEGELNEVVRPLLAQETTKCGSLTL